MTDGRSQDSVVRSANALRRAGIRCLSLGIGRRYNIHQLRQIASSRRDVFTAGFKNLASVVRVIKKKACGTSGMHKVVTVEYRYSRIMYNWVFIPSRLDTIENDRITFENLDFF